jgi:hypothetical protein
MRPSLQRLPPLCGRRTLVRRGRHDGRWSSESSRPRMLGTPLQSAPPPSHLHPLGLVAVAVAASVASTGCGKEEQERVVPVMTCKLEASAECQEIIDQGMGLMDRSQAVFDCTRRGGTYSFATWCPWTAVVGTCSIAGIYTSEKFTLIERYYPPTDLPTAKASCEQRNGVWAPH